jgi:predicted double-glycine peptidase
VDRWLETGGAVLLALCGVALALRLAKLPQRCWIPAYLLSLAVVCIFGLERYTVGLEFVPPFSWVAAGRTRHVLAAFAAPILILTPAARLPRRRDKVFLRIFTGLCLLSFVVMPFFLPALIRNRLAALATKIDPDGVCLQQTSYTCGPAAAVTGLRKLGLPAEEGQLAIWTHTSQFGTTPDAIADALRAHYGADGLEVRYQQFKKVEDLKQPGVTLAVVKYDFMVDHFVAVLGITDQEVIVGDPLSGKTTYSYKDFAKLWRFCGISLKLNSNTHHPTR